MPKILKTSYSLFLFKTFFSTRRRPFFLFLFSCLLDTFEKKRATAAK